MVDVLMVLVIDMVVHSLEARMCGGLAGGREAVCSFLQARCRELITQVMSSISLRDVSLHA